LSRHLRLYRNLRLLQRLHHHLLLPPRSHQRHLLPPLPPITHPSRLMLTLWPRSQWPLSSLKLNGQAKITSSASRTPTSGPWPCRLLFCIRQRARHSSSSISALHKITLPASISLRRLNAACARLFRCLLVLNVPQHLLPHRPLSLPTFLMLFHESARPTKMTRRNGRSRTIVMVVGRAAVSTRIDILPTPQDMVVVPAPTLVMLPVKLRIKWATQAMPPAPTPTPLIRLLPLLRLLMDLERRPPPQQQQHSMRHLMPLTLSSTRQRLLRPKHKQQQYLLPLLLDTTRHHTLHSSIRSHNRPDGCF